MKQSTATAGTRRKIFTVHGAVWYRLHLWLIRHLPAWTFGPLILFFIVVALIFLRRINRAIMANFEVVLGPGSFWQRRMRLWRNLYTYSWCLTERYEALAGVRPIEPEVEGLEYWQEADAGAGGFLTVTAHLGHWEAASTQPTHRGKVRTVNVVREAEVDREAQEFFVGLLKERGLGNYVVHFATADGALGPALLFALRRGEIVALQGDRPAVDGRALEVELFDRPFAVPLGPMALARSADAMILPIFSYRIGRLRSRLVFRPPIRVVKTADRDADLRQGAERLAAEIEAAIRRDPYQWFCFRRMWPET